MSIEDVTRDLFDRWARVWHDGEYDLISGCVAPIFIRHDHLGDRAVTRDSYQSELANVRANRPGIRVVVFDHAFNGARAWFRFEFRWTDPGTGEPQTQAGMQSYRIEGGNSRNRLPAATGSAWPDPVAEETWRSPPPRPTEPVGGDLGF